MGSKTSRIILESFNKLIVENDFHKIIGSDRMFARKFSLEYDRKIVEEVLNYINR